MKVLSKQGYNMYETAVDTANVTSRSTHKSRSPPDWKIYRIWNKETNKSYIGKTGWVKTRITSHFRCATDSYISRAIKQHGARKFDWEVVCSCDTEDDLNAQEVYYIKHLNTLAPDGYNLRAGGEGGTHHPETRKKIGLSNTGRVVSESTRLKMRVARTGTNASAEARLKMSIARRGSLHCAYGKPKVACWRVGQYTTKGELVCVFSGITQAAQSIKTAGGSTCEGRGTEHSITTAITGVNKQVTAYGSRWIYGKDPDFVFPTNIGPLNKLPHPSSRRVEQYSLSHEYIRTFESASEAARKVDGRSQNIALAAGKGFSSKSNGFTWKFECAHTT